MNQIQKDVLTLACTAYNDGDEATIFWIAHVAQMILF